ncbi:hypothetical protein [Paenibacillus larvae]|uniref:hypothetical protein n=1 Tax=Paenibacillus larvae TaxID=1464 RepID=UPI00288CC8D6|nr:hypothetical protein [Paenibacillus larvae]MDT2191299.1 hypothetical protein [Paenibacillus larvae]
MAYQEVLLNGLESSPRKYFSTAAIFSDPDTFALWDMKNAPYSKQFYYFNCLPQGEHIEQKA